MPDTEVPVACPMWYEAPAEPVSPEYPDMSAPMYDSSAAEYDATATAALIDQYNLDVETYTTEHATWVLE